MEVRPIHSFLPPSGFEREEEEKKEGAREEEKENRSLLLHSLVVGGEMSMQTGLYLPSLGGEELEEEEDLLRRT